MNHDPKTSAVLLRPAVATGRFAGAVTALLALAAHAACERAPAADADARTASTLLLTAEAEERPVAEQIAPRQRELLRRLSDSTADPTDYLSSQFTFFDSEVPGQFRRGLGGGIVTGTDYLEMLTNRLAPGFADIAAMELFQPNDNPAFALMLTRHDSVAPAITTWVRDSDTWKAAALSINVSEQRIAILRRDMARR